MSDLQKTIIDTLLKEKKKTKRDLAKLLNIKENSINRLLKSSNITISKLGIIAGYLDVDIIDLLPKKESVHDLQEEFQSGDSPDAANQLTISNLSEALNRNSKAIENLVRIISENFPEKNQDR